MRPVIAIGLAAVVGIGLVGAPLPVRAQDDFGKVELMLYGLTAIYSSTVMTMNAYRAGLLTKEEAKIELDRNEKFLAVLVKCGTKLKREAALDEHQDVSFAQDFLQVCNYLQLALDSFGTFVTEGNELDRKLFDRYLFKGEQAMSRLLKQFSGE